MTTYKFITDKTVAKIDADGKSRMSCTIEHPDYLAWLAEGNTPDPVDPPTAEELAAIAQAQADAAAKDAAKADNVVQYLRDHTPAEVDAYILNAVADLPPSARQMFRKMGLMLCVLSKQSLR
jgi:hypothetical protein